MTQCGGSISSLNESKQRCVIVIDIDAFYAQVEELKEPGLNEKPMAVFQKFLVITCNYVARARGVTKLMRKEEALSHCPELILKNGEDTTPYRLASKAVLTCLEAWALSQDRNVVVGKLGMDEFCLDVSPLALRLAAAERGAPFTWQGHVYQPRDGICSEEALAGRGACFRPMDLRSMASISEQMACGYLPEERILVAGSHLAQQVRLAVSQSSGLKTSAGIAENLLLAKLAAGLHKPNAQTSFPSRFAESFLAPLSIAVLPGVGRSACDRLQIHGFETISQVPEASLDKLQKIFHGVNPSDFAERLRELSHGRDSRQVQMVKAPMRISVEDSFRKCSSWEDIRHILHVLAPDLVARVREDGRQATRFTVSWRHLGTRTLNNPHGDKRVSASRSCSYPSDGAISAAQLSDSLVRNAEKLLSEALAHNSFHLTKINLAASSFSSSSKSEGAKQQQILGALGIRSQAGTRNERATSSATIVPLMSKAEERNFREMGWEVNKERPTDSSRIDIAVSVQSGWRNQQSCEKPYSGSATGRRQENQSCAICDVEVIDDFDEDASDKNVRIGEPSSSLSEEVLLKGKSFMPWNNPEIDLISSDDENDQSHCEEDALLNLADPVVNRRKRSHSGQTKLDVFFNKHSRRI